MKRGFSFTTMILVGVLLGALVWVGHIVNPIGVASGHDHDHGDEHAPAETANTLKPMPTSAETAKARESEMMAREKRMREQQMAAKQAAMTASHSVNGKVAPPAKPDPMDSSYFYQHNMGATAAKPDAKPRSARRQFSGVEGFGLT